MRLQFSFILAALVGLSGCAKVTEQNPWDKADIPDYAKNAKPGVQEPPIRGISADKLVIGADTRIFRFTEGVESQYAVRPQVLDQDYEMVVSADNLYEFDGASFEPNTEGNGWVFAWKPPANFVAMGDSSETTLKISVGAIDKRTTNNKKVVQKKVVEFTVRVTADRGAPVIVREENLPSQPLREGNRYDFRIVVKDPTPVTTTTVAPTLLFSPLSANRPWDTVDISAALSVVSVRQDRMDPQTWIYDVRADLTSRYVTRDKTKAGFRVIAVSRAKLQSSPKTYSLAILPQIKAPQATISQGEQIVVHQGEKVRTQILFMDTDKVGEVTAVTTTSPLPKGLVISCRTPSFSDRWMSICTLEWAVPADAVPATYDITIRATNTSTVPGDKAKQETRLGFKIKVVQNEEN